MCVLCYVTVLKDTFLIHIIWILSVLYRILTYFLFFGYYFHYNIYDIILISLHRTAGPYRCLFFDIYNTFVVLTTDSVTIHGCCLITLYTFSTIRANVSSLLSTDTKVSEINCYLHYCYFFIAPRTYSRQNRVTVSYSPTIRLKICVISVSF